MRRSPCPPPKVDGSPPPPPSSPSSPSTIHNHHSSSQHRHLSMPRRIIAPGRSCLECRRRKIKCDRCLPCAYCVRSKTRCQYPEPPTNKQVEHGECQDVASRLALVQNSLRSLEQTHPELIQLLRSSSDSCVRIQGSTESQSPSVRCPEIFFNLKDSTKRDCRM